MNFLLRDKGNTTNKQTTGSHRWGVYAEEPSDKPAAYLEQVVYINGQINTLVDKIISNSEPEPIIIIQSDHGQSHKNMQPGDMTRILNAYYFPDIEDGILYDSITPVNSFRIVLNQYFGQNFDLLEDVSYIINPDGSTKIIRL